MNKKKQITKESFIIQLNEFSNKFVGVEDHNRIYKIEGGRGLIYILQKIFADEMNSVFNSLNITFDNSTLNLSSGYKITKFYIPGIGIIEMEYKSKYDKSKESQEIFYNLPECCYKGEVFIEGESQGFISGLVEAPYESIEEIKKAMAVSINRFQEELDNYKKELDNLQLQ